MTFNPDTDPKTWKAEISALKAALEHQIEISTHAVQQQKKWQKLYFEMKEKYERCDGESLIKALSKEVIKHVETDNRG